MRTALRKRLNAPPPESGPKLHRIKHVARMLQQELGTIYNWHNLKNNPLPVIEAKTGYVVDEDVLLEWLTLTYPELVFVWQANARLSEDQLALQEVGLPKHTLFVKAVKEAVAGNS